MKQTDIKKCAICNNGMMHTGNPVFYTVKIQSHIFDLGACKRQTGLEMMLGGHAQLANIMGPDEDMVKPLSKEINAWICQDCAIENLTSIISLLETEETDESNEDILSGTRIKRLGE
jgi:hypothetical protein